MFSKSILLVFFSLTLALQCNAFTPISTKAIKSPSPPTLSSTLESPSTTTTQLQATPEVFMTTEGARRLFFLWFFGASGGGGIAVGAFPGMYDNFQSIQKLKGVGPTLGGEKIGLSPLCLYPEDLCLKDVEKILNNKMSVEMMVQKGPKDSFWAERGYLRYEAFVAANKNCNPLAIRAIFDAMTTSVSTVSPIVAQESLDEFKADINAFKTKLLLTKLQGYSAIAFLLFLLGIAAATCWGSFQVGWFPDWPGDDITTIPQYWI